MLIYNGTGAQHLIEFMLLTSERLLGFLNIASHLPRDESQDARSADEGNAMSSLLSIRISLDGCVTST